MRCLLLSVAFAVLVAAAARGQEIPSTFTHTRREAGPDAVEFKGLYNTSEPGRVWIAWGEDALDRRAGEIEVPIGNGRITPIVHGLVPGKEYRYAMVAQNPNGTYVGETRIFRKRGVAGYAVSIDYGGAHWFYTEQDQRPFFPTQSLTAEMWVRPTKHGVALSEQDQASPMVKQTALIELLPDGEMMARVVGLPAISIGRVPTNEWSHIAVRYDHSTQQLHGWVNGVKSPNVGVGVRLEGHEWNRPIIYVFASGMPSGMIGTGDPLIGHFDEVRLWNLARTDEEITRDYKHILYGHEAGLKAYYRCDVRRAMSLTDHSGNGNRADIVGQGDAVSGARVAPALTPVESVGDLLRLQFLGTPGNEMRLQFTRDFVTWQNGPSAIPDSLGVATFEVAKTIPSPVFYRAEPFWPLESGQF